MAKGDTVDILEGLNTNTVDRVQHLLQFWVPRPDGEWMTFGDFLRKVMTDDPFISQESADRVMKALVGEK